MPSRLPALKASNLNHTTARRDPGYAPRVSMAEGTAELIAHLRDSGTL